MPELPEVETVRRQLEPELVGKKIVSASVLDERLTRPEPPRALERAVTGREVTAVARRGKYLLIGLEGGIVAPTKGDKEMKLKAVQQVFGQE
jgi:formamidopyrimidine-DNA glycosylase